MDKFLINSDKNTGLSNVATNINSLNRNQILREAHARQRDYNKVLKEFKRDMIYKINDLILLILNPTMIFILITYGLVIFSKIYLIEIMLLYLKYVI